MEPPEDGAADETARPTAASGPTAPGRAGSAGADGDGPDPAEPDTAGRGAAEPDAVGARPAGPDAAGPDEGGPDEDTAGAETADAGGVGAAGGQAAGRSQGAAGGGDPDGADEPLSGDDAADEPLDADDGAGEDDEAEDEAEELGGISQLSLPARLVVALAVAAVAVGAAFHLGMVFLSIAPMNTVSDEYSQELNDYVYPEFEQNWKLFAPNPVQENNDVQVRAQIRKPDGSVAQTGWVDLTAIDIAKIRHDPIPSHTVQNELRRAIGFYTDTHDNQDRAIGLRGDLSQEYMLHIVAQRLGTHLNGGLVQEVQARLATTPVGAPPWDTQKIPTNTSYRVLPWWAVTAEDYT